MSKDAMASMEKAKDIANPPQSANMVVGLKYFQHFSQFQLFYEHINQDPDVKHGAGSLNVH